MARLDRSGWPAQGARPERPRQPRQVMGTATVGRPEDVALVLDQHRRRHPLRRDSDRHRRGRPPSRVGLSRRLTRVDRRVEGLERARGRRHHPPGDARRRHRQGGAGARARCRAPPGRAGHEGHPAQHHHRERGARPVDLRGPHRHGHQRVPPPARRGRRARSCRSSDPRSSDRPVASRGTGRRAPRSSPDGPLSRFPAGAT